MKLDLGRFFRICIQLFLQLLHRTVNISQIGTQFFQLKFRTDQIPIITNLATFNRQFKRCCKTYCSSLLCSRSSGLILSKTLEYFTLAVTQAASGAAATEALFAFLASNDAARFDTSCSTDWRFSVVMRLASNDLQQLQ